MTQIEQIKAKIERLFELDGTIKTDYYMGRRDAEKEIREFIESIEKEQPNNHIPAVRNMVGPKGAAK